MISLDLKAVVLWLSYLTLLLEKKEVPERQVLNSCCTSAHMGNTATTYFTFAPQQASLFGNRKTNFDQPAMKKAHRQIGQWVGGLSITKKQRSPGITGNVFQQTFIVCT